MLPALKCALVQRPVGSCRPLLYPQGCPSKLWFRSSAAFLSFVKQESSNPAAPRLFFNARDRHENCNVAFASSWSILLGREITKKRWSFPPYRVRGGSNRVCSCGSELLAVDEALKEQAILYLCVERPVILISTP